MNQIQRAGACALQTAAPTRPETSTPGVSALTLAAGGLPHDKVAHHRPTDVQGALDRISMAVQRAMLRVEASRDSESEAVSGQLTATRGGRRGDDRSNSPTS